MSLFLTSLEVGLDTDATIAGENLGCGVVSKCER